MLINYVPSYFEEESTFELLFLLDENKGYGFPCDKNGNVDINKLTETGRNNYQFCLENPEKFRIYKEINEVSGAYLVHAQGDCDCGKRIELVNQYHGACQCPKCGKWYNLFGEELLSPDKW